MSENSIKNWMLGVHEQSFSPNCNVILYKDYPGLVVGDVLEIYHADGEFSRLLVDVSIGSLAPQQKGSIGISVIKSLATAFELRQYQDVCVNKVEKSDVTLDMVELIFKDHFVTRSDCWRLHQSLIGSCVYFCNKVSFITMRVHANEFYMKGNQVACGVIGESTKIVYRSQSAMFHIMIQMSAEMWTFDFHGDLYFEKAIMGFLQDLFNKWKDKDMNCYHQVVIVLFSRTYFDAKSIDEFPKEKHNEFMYSADGRLCKDFYKIILQSEKQDNLKNVILDLKRSFNGYLHYVDCQQQLMHSKGEKLPKGLGYNSYAAEGNLLEAINLSLNVFEKQYIDRNLEETNCTTLIISPSTGVFEVAENLANITEKRLIENAVGVDMVCLAEQPLHSVPLLKYRSSSKLETGNSYTVPQWINLSYYSRHYKSSVFVPRIQVPHRLSDEIVLQWPASCNHVDEDFEYDQSVFNYSKKHHSKNYNLQKVSPTTNSNRRQNNYTTLNAIQSSPEILQSTKKLSLQESGPIHFLHRSISEDVNQKEERHGSFNDVKFLTIYAKENTNDCSHFPFKSILISKKGTINPFKPHHMANVMTLFKFRWMHAFPLNLKSWEHYPNVLLNLDMEKKVSNLEIEEVLPTKSDSSFASSAASDDVIETDHRDNNKKCSQDSIKGLSKSNDLNELKAKKSLDNKLSDDWAFTKSSGVDWKSLCMPAILPLTIDCFPDENDLKKQYSEYHYTLVIEEDNDQTNNDSEKVAKLVGRFDRNAMPPEKKFMEMISQRLTQGFQFVTNHNIKRILKLTENACHPVIFDAKKECILSLGRSIHRLKLTNSQVQVTRYLLCDSEQCNPIPYKYNLWPPSYNFDHYACELSEFQFKSSDRYNWNNLDEYICETEKECVENKKSGELSEGMLYFRTRFLLLPVRQVPLSTSIQTENIVMQQIEGFIRFIETLNKIKRGTYNKDLFYCRHQNPATTPVRKVSYDHSKEIKQFITPTSIDRKDRLRESPSIIDLQENHFKDDLNSNSPASPAISHGDSDNCLSVNSPLVDIKKAMLNQSSGLYFLSTKDQYLRNNTFISAEAVAWMIKSVVGCNSQKQAVALGQQLLVANHIRHASGSATQNFVDGFFLFFIIDDKKEGETENKFWFGGVHKTDEELLMSYSFKWLEVSVTTDQYDLYSAPFLMKDFNSMEQFKKSTSLYKTMEYNLDGNERSEWCTIDYHGDYHPYNIAYAIELNWMVATGCIIAELVQKLSHKATSCGVHIVPAPMCAFPSKAMKDKRNPFRRSAFIRLNVDCLLKEGQKELFEEYPLESRSKRMLMFQQAILRRFDFLRDLPKSDLTDMKLAYQYIHSSGSVLIKINDFMMTPDVKITSSTPNSSSNATSGISTSNTKSPYGKKRKSKDDMCVKTDHKFDETESERKEYGYFWVYNYALSKKWRSSYTGDVASSLKFAAEVSDFCFNKDDQLLEFWKTMVKTFDEEAIKPEHYNCKCCPSTFAH
ncbi:GATOR1 complex protein DEPDC5 isoform X3 [Hydra vulgaris]|uniref:GATOR1 complex protein DEPDC5 isoform X3 n=2 Tax=Hydra vulgaris TaxID=6087 RepID=A0ABM4BEQ2_HYDVU